MPSPYYPFMSLTGRGHDTFLSRIICKKSLNLDFSLIEYDIGVRAGVGGRVGYSAPEFWATHIFWAARENLGKGPEY